MRWRFLIACAAGICGALYAALHAIAVMPRDFSQVWFAARAILHGQDPYALVGPGRAFDWPNLLYYPLPAALLALPLSPLPDAVACAIFAGLGLACFTWALQAHGPDQLLLLVATPVLFALEVAQWSPLLAASLVIPSLGLAFVAKPTIGAALFVARPSWWPIVAGAVLTALAFAVQPGWFAAWWQAVHETSPGGGRIPYTPPVLLPGGPLALLALLRWRRPEARLIAALACVPQTTLLYEAVPLLLVPRTIRESGIVVALSYAAVWIVAHRSAPAGDLPGYLAASGRAMVWCLYLPCVFMVLPRPNEGAVPAWLETRIAQWPAWLKGRAGALSDAIT